MNLKRWLFLKFWSLVLSSIDSGDRVPDIKTYIYPEIVYLVEEIKIVNFNTLEEIMGFK